MGINKSVPGIKNSVQNDINWSFDEDFGVLAVEGLVYNPVTGTMDRMVQAGEILPTAGNNPSFSYNITGSTCIISQIMGAVTYQKTFDWSTNPITEGVWVQI